jgi:hypothetical protein
VKQVRKRWAELTNAYLTKAGSTLRVDHRSYKARGVGAEPTQHRGPNATERRTKREHARRVREEKAMSHPDDKDERPPRINTRRPEPDERNYDLELEQALAQNPPNSEQSKAWEETHAQSRAEGHGPPAWWMRALENARRLNAEQQDLQFPASDPERAVNRADYDSTMAVEAERAPLDQREYYLLNSLERDQEPMREQLESLFHSRRIAALKDRDDRRLVADLAPRLSAPQRQALAEYMDGPAHRDRERDLPVPGPERELLSPPERDDAERRMLEDYQREERERDRRG